MEYVGRIELATPRLYHADDDLTPPHQTIVDYLDHKPSLDFMNLRTDLKIVTSRKKAAVVYHISRDGRHLEHPHFLEVPLSSGKGLFLKDVISALNSIRGPGMANMYSWSSKRSHGRGFVWKDLSENDLIKPCDDDDDQYVLKGSPVPELLSSWNSRSPADTLTSSNTSKGSSSDDVEDASTDDDAFDSPVVRGKSFGRGADHKPPPPRTLTILTSDTDEIESVFPSPVGTKEACHRHGGGHRRRETLLSAMKRTERDSPSTAREPIERKLPGGGGRVGRPARTTELLWTLVRCGSRSMR